MPPKSVKSQVSSSTAVVSNEETLEQLQSEWTTIAKELALLHEKIDQLDTRREDLASRMWKKMNKGGSEQPSATIIETPTVDVVVSEVPEKVTKTSAKTTKKTKEEVVAPKIEETPEPKKTKAKPKAKAAVAEVEVEVIKKTPVKKLVKKAEPVEEAPKGKVTVKAKSTKETEELKAKIALMNNSSSSDTDLESLSSCSSDSECSGGEDD
jgi:hypothetical protein